MSGFLCPYCGKLYVKALYYQRHLVTGSCQDKSRTCAKCKKVFSKPSNCSKHMRKSYCAMKHKKEARMRKKLNKDVLERNGNEEPQATKEVGEASNETEGNVAVLSINKNHGPQKETSDNQASEKKTNSDNDKIVENNAYKVDENEQNANKENTVDNNNAVTNNNVNKIKENTQHVDNSVNDKVTNEDTNHNRDEVDQLSTSSSVNYRVVSKCVFCAQTLGIDNRPKLLECLHVSCAQCILAFLEIDCKLPLLIHCPVCDMPSKHECIIDNLFLIEQCTASENIGATPAELKCSSCSDNAIATSWCVDCTEYICENCVEAHQRLKVFKNHTFIPKLEAKKEQLPNVASIDKLHMCQLHPQEKLSMYCETCDKVTCRDCQVIDHRNHNYQFVHDIASVTRQALQTLISEMNYKRFQLATEAKFMNTEQNVIENQKRELIRDITTMGLKIINMVKHRSEQIVRRIDDICGTRTKALLEKSAALQPLADNMNHCIEYIGSALEKGSDIAIMTSKKSLMRRLQELRNQRVDLLRPNKPLQIQVQVQYIEELQKAIRNMGTIIVDGKPCAFSSSLSEEESSQQPTSNESAASTVASGSNTLGEQQQQLQEQPQVTSSTDTESSDVGQRPKHVPLLAGAAITVLGSRYELPTEGADPWQDIMSPMQNPQSEQQTKSESTPNQSIAAAEHNYCSAVSASVQQSPLKQSPNGGESENLEKPPLTLQSNPLPGSTATVEKGEGDTTDTTLRHDLPERDSNAVQTETQPKVHNSIDPNDIVCAVCLENGEVVHCGKCPRVFHRNCHIPNISSLQDKSNTWQCLMCMELKELASNSEVTQTPLGKLSKLDRLRLQRLCLALYCQYEQSLIFREAEPIAHTAYYERICNPISMNEIRNKLESSHRNQYKDVLSFVSDVRLIFRNTYLYYQAGTKHYTNAKYLENFFEEQIKVWLPAFALKRKTNTNESLPSAMAAPRRSYTTMVGRVTSPRSQLARIAKKRKSS